MNISVNSQIVVFKSVKAFFQVAVVTWGPELTSNPLDVPAALLEFLTTALCGPYMVCARYAPAQRKTRKQRWETRVGESWVLSYCF